MLISLLLVSLFMTGAFSRVIWEKMKDLEQQNKTLVDCTVKVIQKLDETTEQNEQLLLILKDVKLRAEPAHFVTRI